MADSNIITNPLTVKCKGVMDRGAYKGGCPNMASTLSNDGSDFCDYCNARNKFFEEAINHRQAEICKGGCKYGDDDECNRKSVYDGYCGHCLTYYDQ